MRLQLPSAYCPRRSQRVQPPPEVAVQTGGDDAIGGLVHQFVHKSEALRHNDALVMGFDPGLTFVWSGSALAFWK